MYDASPKIVVSVWRDYQPNAPLVLTQAVGSQPMLLHANSGLQQEVFSWSTKEDCFGCISDESVRTSLHTALVGGFDAAKHPSDRRCEKLRYFLTAANQALEDAEGEWIASADAPGLEDEDIPVMINPLHALIHQLTWLHEVFSRQPGISILVR